MALVQGPATKQFEPVIERQAPAVVTVVSNNQEIQVPATIERVEYTPEPKHTGFGQIELVDEKSNIGTDASGRIHQIINHHVPSGTDINVSDELEVKDVDPETKQELDTAIAEYMKMLAAMDGIREVQAAFDKVVERIVTIAGCGHMFQDTYGTVYRVQEATGTFVSFKRFEIAHTRRKHLGEAHGMLSLSAARDAGFNVE